MKREPFPTGRKLIAAIKAEKCTLPKDVQNKLASIQSLMTLPKE